MLRLMTKMGKKGAALFALLIFLAIVQAFSDLMLPDLMGRIISIIQNAPTYESSIGELATDVVYTGLIMLSFAILSAAASMRASNSITFSLPRQPSQASSRQPCARRQSSDGVRLHPCQVSI